MKHNLVLPDDLKDLLDDAYRDSAVVSRWTAAGITSVNDMLNRIVMELNRSDSKLCIAGYRFEDKAVIKVKVENTGNTSKYAGYLGKENGMVDGLFFFIPPKLDSGNDMLTRQVMPVLLGIYAASYKRQDKHFNSRPVYIVNICETNRSNQKAVKTTFVSAGLLGFHYMDVFKRGYLDVIDSVNKCRKIRSVEEYEQLLGANDIFTVDHAVKTIVLRKDMLAGSSNITADIYRFCLKAIPVSYLAVSQNYKVDASQLNTLKNDIVRLLVTYFNRL